MTRLTSATALGLVLASTPAMAEITPMSVWEQLNSYYTSIGLTVETQSVEEAGDTVTVRGLMLKQEAPTGSTEGNLGDLVLSATGDGGVSVDMADEMNMTVVTEFPETTPAPAMPAPDANAPDAATPEASAEDEARQATVEISMRMPGETITVHEEGAGNRYNYTIPSIEISVDRIEGVDGRIIENPGKLTMTDVSGNDLMESGDLFKMTQAGTIASMVVDFDITDPEEPQNFGKGTVTIADFAVTSNATVPPGQDIGANLSEAIAAGLDMSGTMKFGKTDMNIEFGSAAANGPAQNGSATSTSEGGDVSFAMSDGRVRYAGTTGATQAEATMSALPIPLSYGIEGGNFDIDFPVLPKDETQPFKFVYAFNGLTMSDGIWSLFDPQALLSRDPANVVIDLAGDMTLDVDILDPEAMSNPAATPGEINSLTVNNVQVTALGADIAVNGSLTSPEGGNLSAPVGKLTGTLTGVNALLQNLAQAGLLPQEQVMASNMMLGMFTKPDPQDASKLTSEIEFREGGQVFANGQQVK